MMTPSKALTIVANLAEYLRDMQDNVTSIVTYEDLEALDYIVDTYNYREY